MTVLTDVEYKKLFVPPFTELILDKKKIIIHAAFDQLIIGDWDRDSYLHDALSKSLKYRKFKVWNLSEDGPREGDTAIAINEATKGADLIFLIISNDTLNNKSAIHYISLQMDKIILLNKKFCILRTDTTVSVPQIWENFDSFDMSNKEDLIKFVEFVNNKE